jgi:NAD+ dependent glucose-6-phosphate dehydrogenase
VSVTRVVVTGSTGNLGEKALAALRTLRDVEIIRIGRNSKGLKDVFNADLEVYSPEWAKTFSGADVVLHLAADPKPIATWESVQTLNIDLALNVLRASEEAGVKRFVFASSNWVLGGYRFLDTPLAADTPPRPINPYGASKLFIERVGIAQSARTGMAFLALRIGYCAPGANIPGPHMGFGRWGQEMWLSNEDWAQAVVKSCTAPFQGAAVINIMSENQGMRWDLEGARAAIGYVPTSRHTPVLGALGRAKDLAARLREAVIPQFSDAPRIGRRW